MSIDAWLAADPYMPTPAEIASKKAVLAWRRIQDNPTDVAFRNATGNTISSQTVRIESDNRPTESKSVAGSAPRRKVVIFGIRDHPTLPDTDIREGYHFSLPGFPGDRYTVQDVLLPPGEVQAIAEASR